MHFEPGAESSAPSGEKRKKERTPLKPPPLDNSSMDEDLPRVPPIPVTWTLEGGDDALTWKRQKGSTTEAEDDHEEFQTLEKEF